MAGARGQRRRRALGLVLVLALMVGLFGFQAALTFYRPADRAGVSWSAPEFGEVAIPRPPLAPREWALGPSSASPGSARPLAPSPGWLALDRAYRRLAAGDQAGAERAFERALALGHEPQRAALELGYLAKSRGDDGTARTRFASALRGPDAKLAARARAELAQVEERASAAAARTAALPGAGAPFTGGEGAGGHELAAGAVAGRDAAGRAPALAFASRGHAPPAASRDAWTLDLYAEAVGWNRLAGPATTAELVPTFRLRALRRLPLERDLSVYGFAQLTRELGGIEYAGGEPLLHADDAALVGAGLLLRLAGGHAGLFAQAGSAVATAPGRAGEVRLDARAGGFLAAETARCWPASGEGIRLRLDPCAEVYGEAVYTSRFAHDVSALARGRAGATLLSAGPLALGVVAEARAAADRNGDWYDNLGELGAGLRARLLAPFRLDVTATAVAGRYLGRAGRDPAPPDLGYADLRLLAATFVEF